MTQYIGHRNEKYRIGNIVNKVVITLLVTDGDCTCGDERGVVYGIVASLCCPHDTNVTLHVNYTSIEKQSGFFIATPLVK